MNARTLARSAFALCSFGIIVACSAAPETIESSSGQLSLGPPAPPPPKPLPVDPGPPQPPSPPVWPPANPTYCYSFDFACLVTAGTGGPSRGQVDPALLTSLGCTQSYGLTGVGEYPNGTTFAVCVDSPTVRDDLSLLTIGCDRCLPQLPAGEIYIDTHIPPKHKPNCPSGCPGGTSSGGKGGGVSTSQ